MYAETIILPPELMEAAKKAAKAKRADAARAKRAGAAKTRPKGATRKPLGAAKPARRKS